MKTSLLLVIAIFLNTTLLLAEPVALLVEGINPWVFAATESLLLFGYFLNQWLKRFRHNCELELGDFNRFIFKSAKKKS
ncbi:hypothetical protein FGM00_14220 [Aggregatimonas sangjinii]|uniref:Uncharacterized protein n=1 Tax=Aggregatimonas sangjinii TaxID=2583587 RepID=A0A5B7SWT0_9FLAO|nr:hypothetical protein [Aggregatimonas sangjinii]QCX01210.1 hypothetical protein FGM00_14220 [Aggregatimonas sangjinii]